MLGTDSQESTVEALRHDPTLPDFDEVIKDLADDDAASGKRRILCPKCGWSPGPGDLWMCRCGCSWNTFETGGECPDCSHKWHQTQCLLCGEWSPHDDWYTDDRPDS